jgi:hypothetical protein
MLYTATDPIRIEPDAYYDDAALRLLLQLSSATLSRARREGSLRHVRRGHRIYYLGDWVRAWLTAPTCNEPLRPQEERHGAS